MNAIVIDVAATGRVSGMHRDEFNLSFLGRQKISRASELTHNPETGRWEIRVPPDEFATREIPSHMWPVVKECGDFPSYNASRDFEVKWMNACRLAGVKPPSRKGRAVATTLRRSLRSGGK